MEKSLKSLGGRPTRERVAEIADRVMQATAEAFARDGSAFKMDDVAELAGVAKQTLYRRWKSKDELILASVERGMANLRVVPEEHRSTDPLVALHACAQRLFESAVHPATASIRAFLRVEAIRGEGIGLHLETWYQEASAPLRELLEKLEQEGRLTCTSVEEAATMLFDLLLAAGSRSMLAGQSDEEKARAFNFRWQAFVCAFLPSTCD